MQIQFACRRLPIFFFTICLFVCSTPVINAQSNHKIDSLKTAYNSEKNNLKKIRLAKNLYKNLRESQKDSARFYLHEWLKISKLINDKDEEAEVSGSLGHFYSYSVLDSARHYFKNAETLFKSNNNYNRLGQLYKAWSKAENLAGNFEEAILFSDASIKFSKIVQDGAFLSDSYQQKSTIYIDKGDYKNALINLINASKCLDSLKEKRPLKEAIIEVGIGRTETLRNNQKEAIPYLKKGISIFEKLNHEQWLAISYMELGNTYYDLKDYKKSLVQYKKGLKISEEKVWNNFIAPYLSNIGAIYLETKKFDKALDHFFRSNKISSRHGSINNNIIFLNDVASAYYGKKDYKKALEYYTNAINLADSIGSIDNLSDAYLERSETYEKLNNFKLAHYDYKNYNTLKDSIFNTTKYNQIEKLKTIYETEKKEQEIVLQKNEIDLLEQKAKVSNLQKFLLGGGLLLSLLVVGFGYYGFKQKLKHNKAEKEKLDNELTFKKKELTTHALHLAKKNEVLENLKQQAQELKSTQNIGGYQHLIRTIDFDLQDDNNWENFSNYFQQVHKDFNSKIKQQYPTISASELRFLSLIKMNLSSKEIASILNISNEGIKKARYRVRKKLGLNANESLETLILSI